MGAGPGRRRVHGLRGQPAASLPVPGAARRVRREERRRGCSCPGGYGAHRLLPASHRGRGHRAGRGGQGGDPHPQDLIWERTRHAHRLRHALRDYFPAALEAFEDLDAPDALELLARAPDPASAARLTTAQISAALKRARRHHIAAKASQIQAVLRAPHLGQPAIVTAAYAVSARALIAVLATLNEQVTTLQGQVEAYFGQHPDAEIIVSQPGLGPVLGARVSQNPATTPAGTPLPKPGRTPRHQPHHPRLRKEKTVAARYVRNDRLIDALMAQAFTALHASPGARACYDRQRARGASHNAALRQLANRLTGILHGCLKTRTLYDEATAWPQTTAKTEKAAA